eukprot:6063261-Lingulodinium_polyedra.AAC.1
MCLTLDVCEACLSLAFAQWPEHGRLTSIVNIYDGSTAWQHARVTHHCFSPPELERPMAAPAFAGGDSFPSAHGCRIQRVDPQWWSRVGGQTWIHTAVRFSQFGRTGAPL